MKAKLASMWEALVKGFMETGWTFSIFAGLVGMLTMIGMEKIRLIPGKESVHAWTSIGTWIGITLGLRLAIGLVRGLYAALHALFGRLTNLILIGVAIVIWISFSHTNPLDALEPFKNTPIGGALWEGLNVAFQFFKDLIDKIN